MDQVNDTLDTNQEGETDQVNDTPNTNQEVNDTPETSTVVYKL